MSKKEEVTGPKGKHRKERTHYHWGRTNGEQSFNGRRVKVKRPRVRSKSGEEALLEHYEAFREQAPLSERVVNQILAGVSTRGYESSLDQPVARLKSRGASKSAASRHLVTQTSNKLNNYLSRRLDELELAVLMVDGLEVAGHTVVVSLGITIDGTKVPLGLWLGSTENSRLCTAMWHDLLDRGLRIGGQILCVVDGGKGIRKALEDVLGDLALIHRCHVHKLRNLHAYLPTKRYAYVRQTMKEAYRSQSVDKATKRLHSHQPPARGKIVHILHSISPTRTDLGRRLETLETIAEMVARETGWDKRKRESRLRDSPCDSNQPV